MFNDPTHLPPLTHMWVPDMNFVMFVLIFFAITDFPLYSSNVAGS